MADIVGLLAGSMVLATFSMRSMLWLRVLALGSNVAFICYGLMLGLWPIWLLHLVLVPLNALRLVQIRLNGRRRSPGPPTDEVSSAGRPGYTAALATERSCRADPFSSPGALRVSAMTRPIP